MWALGVSLACLVFAVAFMNHDSPLPLIGWLCAAVAFGWLGSL